MAPHTHHISRAVGHGVETRNQPVLTNLIFQAIDTIRVKCLRLRCLVLSDGKYFELVKSNFDRADRVTLVRSATSCRINLFYLLSCYKDMVFN